MDLDRGLERWVGVIGWANYCQCHLLGRPHRPAATTSNRPLVGQIYGFTQRLALIRTKVLQRPIAKILLLQNYASSRKIRPVRER